MTSHAELKKMFVANTGRTTIPPHKVLQNDSQLYGFQPARTPHYVWQGGDR